MRNGDGEENPLTCQIIRRPGLGVILQYDISGWLLYKYSILVVYEYKVRVLLRI